jgi:hypothetical protein
MAAVSSALNFWESDMRASLTCALGAAGLAVVGWMQPVAAADNLNSVIRTMNAVLNPDDARRYEDQARRDGRPEEERYWHNYGAGLEQQRGGPRPAAAAGRVGPDEARRLEEQAHRAGRWDEERYWHNYLAGLQGPTRTDYRGEAGPRERGIGPDEASRLEARARAEGHWDEARYWAAYRQGLEGRR